MKKKNIILLVAIVIFILMLIPIPMRLKDGGSVEYKAILYKYTKIHRLSEKSSTGYEDGWDLKILGFHVGGEINTHVQAECCDGCMCGDTLELIKNTETAWTLTTIDSNGNYVYDQHSFINFHGTGKNRFAFFKNDENGNTILEIKGIISITRNADIVLIPDNSSKEITCRIGEEKDLIAILECDNNFGTFTLQKEGSIELPSIIKNTIIKTKKIVITGNKNKTITDENDINEIINIIIDSNRWTEPITLPSVQYDMELFDDNNKSIAKIEYTPGHYFTVIIDNNSYNLGNIDNELFKSIIEK